MQYKLITFLESIYGTGKHTSKDNYSFYCPVCNHRKRKLEVGLESHKWHCWICGNGGTNLYTLLKWTGAPKERLSELSSVLGRKVLVFDHDPPPDEVIHNLPPEFIPLSEPNPDNFFWRTALRYLAGRGVTELDILKYNIGYCVEGSYANMVIIPNYDDVGYVNYFLGRSFMPRSGMRFLNPNTSKDIIGFASMINWSEPVVLVESSFDAISVRRNAIPLYGKSIPTVVKQRIIERKTPRVYICLDSDAYSEALKQSNFFIQNGIETFVVELPEGHDPNSLGYTEVWKYINESVEVDSSTLYKISMEGQLDGRGKKDLPYRRYSRATFPTTQRV